MSSNAPPQAELQMAASFPNGYFLENLFIRSDGSTLVSAMKPEQPGVNCVRASRTNYLHYTSTAKKLFMRVKVNPMTLAPAHEPELAVAGRMGDDFCIDEDTGYVYLATHRCGFQATSSRCESSGW